MSHSLLFAQQDESGYINYYDSDGYAASSSDEEEAAATAVAEEVIDAVNEADRARSDLLHDLSALSKQTRDFQNEMESELDRSIGDMKQQNSSSDQFYDKVYFDSDEETEANVESRRKLTDDQLFYDPNMDDEDELWVKNRRQLAQGHRQTSAKEKNDNKTKQPSKPAPYSDAVLTCPACLNEVCYDCQQHETYEQQFRAMFVVNCVVDTSQVSRIESKPDKRKLKRASSGQPKSPSILEASEAPEAPAVSAVSAVSASSSQSRTELVDFNDFHPVHCAICNTQLAYYDKDEVYHFYNVLAGPGD